LHVYVLFYARKILAAQVVMRVPLNIIVIHPMVTTRKNQVMAKLSMAMLWLREECDW